MTTLRNTISLMNAIQQLARQATRTSLSLDAQQLARRRLVCPVDYMRYAEFEAVLDMLGLEPGMTVLDVSSPQWFSMLLAHRHPEIMFKYVNLVPRELAPYREIAQALGLKNLEYQIADVRQLNFQDNTFDRVISISVIEHIYPADGGDITALQEINRVLKPGGTLIITVPYKTQGQIVYVDGPVYERDASGRNFFAREYDAHMFARLIEKSALTLSTQKFICEQAGPFAIDYYEWGPGRNTLPARINIKARKLIQRIFGVSLDRQLAERYLRIADDIQGRVVNIAAALRKA